MEHSAAKASAAPPPDAPPSWRRHGVDKFSGDFRRASGLPVPPNEKDSRKRLSGLSVYSLSTAERAGDESHVGFWGQDMMEGVQVTKTSRGHALITGGWREREREREAAKEARRQAMLIGSTPRSGERNSPSEDSRQAAKRRMQGEARWATAPSNGGRISGSAALLVSHQSVWCLSILLVPSMSLLIWRCGSAENRMTTLDKHSRPWSPEEDCRRKLLPIDDCSQREASFLVEYHLPSGCHVHVRWTT